MTQVTAMLIENEFKNYVEKTKELEFKQIQLDDLFLNKTSGFDLINQMRRLIRDRYEFLKSIQNRETIPHIQKIALTDVYEKVETIITNHFEDKVNIMKTFHSRESYERIMTFLMFLFEKFEIE